MSPKELERRWNARPFAPGLQLRSGGAINLLPSPEIVLSGDAIELTQ
ncbi:MAG: hypothetical protein ACJ790_03315 [Myxococcaceae bacterium]